MKSENPKVYVLKDLNDNVFYVGSTKKYLSTRFGVHRWEARHGKTKKVSNKIRSLNYEFKISLVEESDPENVRSREQFWIEEYTRRGNVLANKNKAFGAEETRREYLKSEEYKIYYKAYRLKREALSWLKILF